MQHDFEDFLSTVGVNSLVAVQAGAEVQDTVSTMVAVCKDTAGVDSEAVVDVWIGSTLACGKDLVCSDHASAERQQCPCSIQLLPSLSVYSAQKVNVGG